MNKKTAIEWTEYTWNPITGCTKISPGCKHCYAEKFSIRLKSMGNKKYRNGFKVTTHYETLNHPFSWKKGRLVFVNSMSDLFHEEISEDFIQQVFSVMRNNPLHTFQVLTKRSKRLLKMNDHIDWPLNVWMGVSVENEDYLYRIDHLREIKASVKFLSLEPLLSPIKDFKLSCIDWVIVGGESGPKARPLSKDWVIDVRNNCIKNGVPFFFKQWGGVNKKKKGRLLEGQTWDEIPIFNSLTAS